jgi:hypothetical protein
MGAPSLVSRLLRDRAGILIFGFGFEDLSQLPHPSTALRAGSVAKNATSAPSQQAKKRACWEPWGGAPQSFGRRENKLQFKVKDKEYFLAFVEQERRWYVFAPTAQGVYRIPVYVDPVKYERAGVLGTETTLSS